MPTERLRSIRTGHHAKDVTLPRRAAVTAKAANVLVLEHQRPASFGGQRLNARPNQVLQLIPEHAQVPVGGAGGDNPARPARQEEPQDREGGHKVLAHAVGPDHEGLVVVAHRFNDLDLLVIQLDVRPKRLPEGNRVSPEVFLSDAGLDDDGLVSGHPSALTSMTFGSDVILFATRRLTTSSS